MASKFVPEPEETDQLILDTIRKIQRSKKRAYSELVFKKLSKQCGLDESPAMLQLTSMMATGKLKMSQRKRDLESLRIYEAKVNLHVESQEENGKGRMLSNDEDKIIECRNELQAVAEAEQEKLVSSEKGKSCDSDMESNSDNDSDMESDSDTESIQSGNAESALFSENMKERVGILERQISDILHRLDNQDSEKKDARQIIYKDFQEMLAKIWLLEKENRAFFDENLALNLENSEIREIFMKSVHENNDKKKDISQLNQKNAEKIPKKLSNKRKQVVWRAPGSSQGKLRDNNNNNSNNKLFAKTDSAYSQI